MFKTTMPTLKRLARTIGFTFDGVYVVTPRTSLAGVCGWDKHDWNASNICLVPYEQPQLVKRPIIGSAPFSFATWFSIKRFSDISQILKRKRSITTFCVLNNLLGNIVIKPLLKALFSPGEPSHQSSGTASAFGLNISSDRPQLFCRQPAESFAAGAVSVTSSLNLLTTPRLSTGSSSNVVSSQVHPNYTLGVLPVGSVGRSTQILM